jgi:general secretion pathway protein D
MIPRLAQGLRLDCRSALLALLLCVPLLALAEPEPTGVIKDDKGQFTINMRDTDIRAFITAIGENTGQNFVVDPRVKGNVTVISSAPTDAKALYDVFLSILKVHGFAAIPSGDMVKIVPDATAKQEGQDTAASYVARDNDALVTAVVPVRHVSAPELVAVLRPLLPQEAHLAGFAASNVLVVADSGVNVRRMMRIVAQLDTASDKSIQLVELKHADAEEVVRVMNSLSGDPGKQQSPGVNGPQFIAYGRTNTVLMQAAPNEIERYRRLIAALDVPDRGPDGVEVIPLRFATAADLMPVLQGVLTGESMPPQGNAGAVARVARRRAEGMATVAPGMQQTPGGVEHPGRRSHQHPHHPGADAPVEDAARSHRRLDVRRNQVLVEGIIAELSTTSEAELGIQWKTSQTNNGIVTGSTFSGGSVSPNITGAVSKGVFGFADGLALGYLRGGDIRALLNAFSGDRYTNVLSTPSLMTLDNAEAEIVVGQNVPFVTGSFNNSSTTPTTPSRPSSARTSASCLKVKPQINEGGTVTLELEQEVSSVDSSTRGADLITNKRSIKTTVLVDDSDIVVLGGLIQNNLTENDQKVPWVGDIPVLGHLFKNARNDHSKTNLMVFLRPTIINDREGNLSTATSRYEELRRARKPRSRAARAACCAKRRRACRRRTACWNERALRLRAPPRRVRARRGRRGARDGVPRQRAPGGAGRDPARGGRRAAAGAACPTTSSKPNCSAPTKAARRATASRWRISARNSTWPISPMNCASRPTCSKAPTTRRSSASSTA